MSSCRHRRFSYHFCPASRIQMPRAAWNDLWNRGFQFIALQFNHCVELFHTVSQVPMLKRMSWVRRTGKSCQNLYDAETIKHCEFVLKKRAVHGEMIFFKLVMLGVCQTLLQHAMRVLWWARSAFKSEGRAWQGRSGRSSSCFSSSGVGRSWINLMRASVICPGGRSNPGLVKVFGDPASGAAELSGCWSRRGRSRSNHERRCSLVNGPWLFRFKR